LDDATYPLLVLLVRPNVGYDVDEPEEAKFIVMSPVLAKPAHVTVPETSSAVEGVV